MGFSSLSRDNFKPMEARDAFDIFTTKVPVPSSVFEQLNERERANAFRIANVDNAARVMRIRRRIQQALVDGDFRSLLNELRREVASGDFSAGALNRISIVYRQNMAHAWSVGNMRVLNQQAVKVAFPFRMYMTVGDGTPDRFGVRPEHAALHGRVFSVDDPLLSTYTPPLDWGCRCYMVPLRAADVERLSKTPENIAQVRIDTGAAPAPEFNFPRDQFDMTEMVLRGLDGDLVKELQRLEKNIGTPEKTEPIQ